jgi:hypothetical protein
MGETHEGPLDGGGPRDLASLAKCGRPVPGPLRCGRGRSCSESGGRDLPMDREGVVGASARGASSARGMLVLPRSNRSRMGPGEPEAHWRHGPRWRQTQLEVGSEPSTQAGIRRGAQGTRVLGALAQSDTQPGRPPGRPRLRTKTKQLRDPLFLSALVVSHCVLDTLGSSSSPRSFLSIRFEEVSSKKKAV